MKTAFRHFLISTVAVAAAFVGQETKAAIGDLYVGGDGDHVVYKFTPAGAKSVFASGPNADGIAFDSAGNLFVSDTVAHAIIKIAPDSTETTFAAQQTGETFVPTGLAFNTAGDLFAGNSATGEIYKFTPAGVRSTFASGISGPVGLVFDQSGNLFVSEFNTGSILQFTPAAVRSTFATGFASPAGLTFSAGILYEVDVGTGSVFKIVSPASRTQCTTGLTAPRFLAFDASGNLFVSNEGAQQIVKVVPDGTKTTFASGLSAAGLAFEPPVAILSNISTRAFVQTGDNVLIGGFIISGNTPKKVLVRAIGPSLPPAVPSRMQDPTISLHDSTTAQIDSNDDWQSHPNANQIPANLQPGDPRESAILTTLQPGGYTAIVSGKGGTTGVALVEVYDMDTAATSELANISTRGLVQTGDFVMIGGFIPAGTSNIEVLIRAIGPSLAGVGIANALPDPTVLVFNSQGAVIGSNDNWRDTQEAAILATGKAPTNNLESAVILNLAPGVGYTAIVSDKHGASGIGEVEVFKIQ